MNRFEPKDFWPKDSLARMLESAFHSDADVARQAWQDWLGSVDFDTAPWAEMRLLPAALRRQKQLGVEVPRIPRIDGVKRYIWTASQTNLHAARPLLAALEEHDVPFMVLKGGARHLEDNSAGDRYIADVDILVPRHRFFEVLDIAESAKWSWTWDVNREWLDMYFLSARHSLGLRRDPAPQEVDIHAHSLLLNRCADDDDGLWRRARRAETGGVACLVPDRTDQLLIACAHGHLYDPGRSHDWIGDAAGIIGAGEPDWQQFLTEVERRDLWAPCTVALHYLSHGLELDIPDAVLAQALGQCREPFISEYVGMTEHWDAPTRENRAEWGACASIRASRWRRDNPGSGTGGTAAGDKRVTVWERDNLRCAYRTPVPAWTHDLVSDCSVDIGLPALRTPGTGGFEVVLTCFETGKVEFARHRVTPFRRLLMTVAPTTMTISFDPALLGAYGLKEIEIQFLEEGTFEPAGVDVKSFEVRWHAFSR